MKQILLIRHGATLGNLEKRYIGRTDEPLCEKGISQSLALRQKNFSIDFLFVSPMLRTKQTAQLIFDHFPYTVVDDFIETDFGIFENKNADELCDDLNYRNWVESMCEAPIPKGENLDVFKFRCCRGFSSIISTLPQNSLSAFVVHGGVIMAILEHFALPAKSFYDYHIGNGEFVLCNCISSSDLNQVRLVLNT